MSKLLEVPIGRQDEGASAKGEAFRNLRDDLVTFLVGFRNERVGPVAGVYPTTGPTSRS